MISAPALLDLPPGRGAEAGVADSRGRLLPGWGVEVRAGVDAVGREEEALRDAASDISDLNFCMLAARDMVAVLVVVDGGYDGGGRGEKRPRGFNKELWAMRQAEALGLL